MTTRIHLLLTPVMSDSVGKMIQLMARHYVQYFNQQYGRTGTLWEGRYKSALVDGNQYALDCYRYIERNPLRAGLVNSLEQYPWSSYQHNALGRPDGLLQPCSAYTSLAQTDQERLARYQILCNTDIDIALQNRIRQETNRSRVLGDEKFKRKVENLLGVDLSIKSRGGDRRSDAYRSQAFSCC